MGVSCQIQPEILWKCVTYQLNVLDTLLAFRVNQIFENIFYFCASNSSQARHIHMKTDSAAEPAQPFSASEKKRVIHHPHIFLLFQHEKWNILLMICGLIFQSYHWEFAIGLVFVSAVFPDRWFQEQKDLLEPQKLCICMTVWNPTTSICEFQTQVLVLTVIMNFNLFTSWNQN